MIPETLRHFLTLLGKELLQLFKNRKSRFALLAPPIIQIVTFGYAATLDLTQVDFAVLDHDRSAASRRLVAALTGSRLFRIAATPDSEAGLADAISRRRVLAAVVIPRHFQRRIETDGAAAVQLLADGRNSNTANLAVNYLQTAIRRFNAASRGDTAAVRVESRAWYNPNYNMRYFMIPGLLAMMALLDLMLLTSMSIAREREEGTFDQLLVTPCSPGEIIAAKAAACMTVGLIQLTMAFWVGRWWFQLPFHGSPGLLYFGFFCFMCASVGCGLLISVLCDTLQQAMLGTFLVGVPFGLLSGLTTPVESMPVFFQYLTLANPMRYGIRVLQRLWLEGAGLELLWPQLAALLLLAAAAFTATSLIFRRQLRG